MCVSELCVLSELCVCELCDCKWKEDGGEEAEEAEDGSHDLKTKNPHIDVGKIT